MASPLTAYFPASEIPFTTAPHYSQAAKWTAKILQDFKSPQF